LVGGKTKHYRLNLEYLGTNYFGFQRQPGKPTIQGKLEEVLATVLRHPVSIRGAGRTDAGVHAVHQVATFFTEKKLVKNTFLRSVNSLLPSDIVVTSVQEVPVDFNPRRDAKWREYHYYILNRPYPSAFLKDVTYHVTTKLDIRRMSEAARLLVGQHDFAAFCVKNSSGENTIRTILDIDCTAEANIVWGGKSVDGLITLRVRAHAFLHKMVRIIAGTLLLIGRQKLDPLDISAILEGKEQKKVGPAAPAKGLVLVKIAY
jgi:tRNA pseudouridine38-40 synthase